MKRTVAIIITLMAIGLLSVASSAQKFKFNFTEYNFTPSGSEVETTLDATSVVSVTKAEGVYYTIIITSQALKPRVYDNVKIVDYIDVEGIIEIAFAITDTHCLVIAFDRGGYGAALELNTENSRSSKIIASYTNDIDDYVAQDEFLKVFTRLNEYVTSNYTINKKRTENGDATESALKSKTVDKKTEAQPKTPASPVNNQQRSVAGLPVEIEALPYTELKTKVLRESKGEIQTGMIYRNNYTGGDEPITVASLMEHPLGIPSLGWESLSGEKQMFETLVKQGIGFEGLYKHIFDRRYSPSTALLLKKTLTLKSKVDFGTFSAVWRSYSDLPQMHLNYDSKTGEPSRYPSFTYNFKLSDMPSGYKMDKKKGLKAIKKSFENILDELRRSGFTVTKRKGFKDNFWFEKGNISGHMYLMINDYMVQYTKMVIVISNIGK